MFRIIKAPPKFDIGQIVIHVFRGKKGIVIDVRDDVYERMQTRTHYVVRYEDGSIENYESEQFLYEIF